MRGHDESRGRENVKSNRYLRTVVSLFSAVLETDNKSLEI